MDAEHDWLECFICTLNTDSLYSQRGEGNVKSHHETKITCALENVLTSLLIITTEKNYKPREMMTEYNEHKQR